MQSLLTRRTFLKSHQPTCQGFHKMSILKVVGQSLGYMLEKPSHKVIATHDGYEERLYAPAKWVSTTVESMTQEKGRSEGFRRLFKYITGDNEKDTKIDMTAPVATKILPGLGPNCESKFTVSFYIPEKYQETPVPPKSKDVFIEQFPEMTVYAVKFGGFATDEQFIDEARKLSEKVGENAVNGDFYYSAGYDSPFKLFNRLNEVWLVKKS